MTVLSSIRLTDLKSNDISRSRLEKLLPDVFKTKRFTTLKALIMEFNGATTDNDTAISAADNVFDGTSSAAAIYVISSSANDDGDADVEAGAGMSNEDRQKRNSRRKNVEETYVKKSQTEHIIDLPDTYIGSVEFTQLDTWILDENDEKMTYKTVQYIPGLYKIFDEILVNAIDQYVRTENDESIKNKVTQIKVNIDVENKVMLYLR